MNLWVSETWINATSHHGLGESGVYETSYDHAGELYRAMQAEYGRCTGKVYVDRPEKAPAAIGWVFLGRETYEDCAETYLRETWVTLHDAPDTVTREPHYHVLGA